VGKNKNDELTLLRQENENLKLTLDQTQKEHVEQVI
jgi:hypothetical protein